MSQQKVDRYKQEKAHRKERLEKEKKRKKLLRICSYFVLAVIVLAIAFAIYRHYTPKTETPAETETTVESVIETTTAETEDTDTESTAEETADTESAAEETDAADTESAAADGEATTDDAAADSPRLRTLQSKTITMKKLPFSMAGIAGNDSFFICHRKRESFYS